MEAIYRLSSKSANESLKFRKRTLAQHTDNFMIMSTPVVNFDRHGDQQEEFDQLYSQLHRLLDAYYPEHTVTITTSGSPDVTPI